MSNEQNMPTSEKELFDQFQETLPDKIVIPADHSPSALLPPEELVLVRDRSTDAIVYRGKMSIDFQPLFKGTSSNGNGDNSLVSKEKE